MQVDVPFLGMSHVQCDQKVDISRYLDTDNYYIYANQNGRITSKYIWNGGIEEVPDPGRDLNCKIIEKISNN